MDSKSLETDAVAAERSPVRAETTEHAAALAERAWELRDSDPTHALHLSSEAVAVSRETADRSGLARSLLTLAACHCRLSHLQEALDCIREALPIYEDEGNADGQASSLNMLGNIHVARGEFADALVSYARSLAFRGRAVDRRAEAATLSNVCAVYEKLGDYPRALEHANRSLAIAREIGDRQRIATSLANLGVVHQFLGDHQSATEALAWGAKVFGELRDLKNQAKCLNNLGVICRDLGDYPAALTHYREAHRVAIELKDPETLALVLCNLGDVYRLQGDLEEAERHLRLSQEVARESEVPALALSVDHHFGLLRLDTREPERAIEHFSRSLGEAERLRYEEWICKAHRGLYNAFELRGDLRQALAHLNAFQEHAELRIRAQADHAARALQVRHELERTQHEAEMHRLRHVELARANRALEEATERLRRSDREKSLLLEELREKSALLEQQTREDALTGLSNRRHWEQVLDQEFQRAKRFGRPLTVLVIDVDRFKEINDEHSHTTGDEVLKLVGAIIRSACRTVDGVARYGGDEFVAVLPETPVKEAVHVGERIRREVQALAEADTWSTLRPTVSIGAADDSRCTTSRELFKAADDALFVAKERGRNQVAIHL